MQAILKIAMLAHQQQLRKESKLPFVFHPISVASKLSKCGIFEPVLIAAALLHDVYEDTHLTDADLAPVIDKEFCYEKSQKVFSLLTELTRWDESTPEAKAAYLASFATKSVESLVIKVLDRVDNVEDYAATNPHYAYKYLRKADKLFEAFHNRHAEVIERFGHRANLLINEMIRNVRAIVLPSA